MNLYTQPMLKEDALKDKVAIVTGGGSGLGKAMTKYFLQLGAKVVITSRNLEKLQITAKELEEETGGKVLCVSCDVRNWDEVEAMKEAAIKEFGKIDILLKDYRDLNGKFDAIIAVEMFEAVGKEYFHIFFKKCQELLKPNGV